MRARYLPRPHCFLIANKRCGWFLAYAMEFVGICRGIRWHMPQMSLAYAVHGLSPWADRNRHRVVVFRRSLCLDRH